MEGKNAANMCLSRLEIKSKLDLKANLALVVKFSIFSIPFFAVFLTDRLIFLTFHII